MVRKLQRKFIFITVLSLFIVISIILSTINIFNIMQTENKNDDLIDIIIAHDGLLPREPKDFKPKPRKDFVFGDIPFDFEYSKETPYQTRYFSVKAFDYGEIAVNINSIASIDYIEAIELGESVFNSGKQSGYKGIYKFKVSEKLGYKLLVFLDCRNDILVMKDFTVVSILVGAVFLILVSILISTLSGRAIKPMIENIEKQKRFITDAGHEIKTPLAIISANTEVIEMYNGESEWTQSIRNQVDRLNELTKNLLSLSKMDENEFKLEMEEFHCGEIVSKTIDGFDTLINGKNLVLEKDIDISLKMFGNKNNFCSLISILVDNAVKYTPRDGQIKIFFNKRDNKIEFLILNSWDKNINGDLSYLFDRFYRMDDSRSREEGGYGIGLSLAESIVRLHKGKIFATGRGDYICFKFWIPQNIDRRR